jgi:hypothetical protein
VESYYDRVLIVFIHDVGLYGTVDKLGAFASVVKYKQDGIDFEELLDNEDFSIMDEIVFEHIEEEN